MIVVPKAVLAVTFTQIWRNAARHCSIELSLAKSDPTYHEAVPGTRYSLNDVNNAAWKT